MKIFWQGLALTLLLSAEVGQPKSLYVNKNLNRSFNSPISAFDIDGAGCLTWQATSDPTRYGGAGLAIDTDAEILFVTFETSGTLDIVDATNLDIIDQVTAPAANNLAGIVVDESKSRVYTVNRADTLKRLFVYDWDSDAVPPTLTLAEEPRLMEAFELYGLALDEGNKLLYVADRSATVKVYDTDTWSFVKGVAVSQPPMAVAVAFRHNEWVHVHWQCLAWLRVLGIVGADRPDQYRRENRRHQISYGSRTRRQRGGDRRRPTHGKGVCHHREPGKRWVRPDPHL